MTLFAFKKQEMKPFHGRKHKGHHDRQVLLKPQTAHQFVRAMLLGVVRAWLMLGVVQE
jgi:hypothetical protein